MRTSFWMSGANIKVTISNTKHIRYIHSLLIPRSSFFKRCWIIYSRKKKKTKDVMKGELWSVEQKWEYHGSNLWRKQEREKKKKRFCFAGVIKPVHCQNQIEGPTHSISPHVSPQYSLFLTSPSLSDTKTTGPR